MARPKSKGAYAPLAAQYYMDDAILEAGPDAELLFVRCISFCASVPTDGFITDRQIALVASGLRAPRRRIDSLLNVGLIEQVSGGFLVRSWLKWNRSADEVGKLLAKDRERKARKHAEEPRNSARNPDGIQADSKLQSRAEQSSTEQIENPTDSLPSDETPDASFSDDVKRLCDVLADRVRANGHKVNTVGVTWWQACERLMRIDGYDARQIEWLIEWTMRDEFWIANIRSMTKFREKFSTLVAQAKANPHGRGKSAGQRRDDNALALVAAYREEESHAEVGNGAGTHLRALDPGW